MSIAIFSDVVKRYGTIPALDHVDFEIREGEILGLLGPNGAGKTTAIRALAGLLPIDSGRVEVFGQAQGPGAIALRRRLGLVTQEVTVFEDLSARENLEFFGSLYGLKGPALRKRIRETLEFVGLSDHADQRPKAYSGGMKRRLNIACALTHEPELLIMDEPTVGIDPQSRNHILESVRALRARGTSVLYTSHYMEEVEALATRTVIMDQGHVIAQGTVDELVERVHYESRIHLELATAPEGLVPALRAVPGVKDLVAEGRALTVVSEAGRDNLDQVLRVAQGFGSLLSMKAERPSLEDVFLTLTGKSLRDGDKE
jgi:ABC-2 type transport system ATP-binding protein